MRNPPIPIRHRRANSGSDLLGRLEDRVVGQPQAMGQIVPYVQMHQAGLSPEGRPAGVFLLLGPTGTGKTRTVEALAEVLHGSEKHMLKVDCGEFQMEHEVAKLIGAPPGYLGHRETPPMLTQQNTMSSSISARSSSVSKPRPSRAPWWDVQPTGSRRLITAGGSQPYSERATTRWARRAATSG